MKIRKIALSYYRSIGAQPIIIDFTKTVSVLIGKNNSGKSNIIDFLHLASQYAEVANKKASSSSRHITEEDKHLKKSSNNPIVSIYLDRSHLQHYGLTERDVEGAPDIHFKVVGNKMNITSTFLDNLSNTGKFNFINKKTAKSVNIEDKYVDQLYRTLLGNLKMDKDYLRDIYSQFPEILLIDCTKDLKNDEIQQIRNWRDPDPQKQEEKKLYRKFNSLVRELLKLTPYEIGFSQTTNEVTFDLDGMILPLNSFGKGVERIIRIARYLVGVTDKLVLLEEPETNLHPALQRAFFKYLLEDKDNKYVIATHSNSMIGTGDAVEIIHVSKDDLASISHVLDSKKELTDMLEDIGVKPSDLYLANYIIWVEGPSDRIYLKKYLSLLRPDLRENEHFVFMFYGGYGHLKHISVADETDVNGDDIDLINLLSINPRCAVIIDSDKKAAKAEIDKIRKRIKQEFDDKGLKCWITKKRTIENYIPVAVFEEILNAETTVKGKLEIGPFDDYKLKLKEAWPDVRNKYRKVKLAQLVVNNLTLDNADQELLDEIKSIGSEIERQ